MEKNKRADVVLVSVENGFLPSYALPGLESFLNRDGIKTEILYPAIANDSISSLVSKIKELNPRVVGIGGLFGDRFAVRNIIQSLISCRKNFKIILGGNLATPIPEYVLEKLNADMVVIGEGEIIFSKVVKNILENRDYRNIGGLVFKDGDNIINSGPGEYVEDLDTLLPLNYEKIPMEYFVNVYKFYKDSTRNSLFTPASRLGAVFSGRGCPYKCNFCYHHGKLRLAGVSNVIVQIKELKARFKINLLQFADDLALINKKRTLELCNALMKENLDLKYMATAHLNCLDEKMVIALKESGFVQIGLGLESGSQDILNRMNKGIKVEQIKEALELLRKYEINWNGNIQIGQLGETSSDVKKTRDLFYPYIDRLSTISVGITTPYPGTPLYYYGLKNGLIKDLDFLYRRIGDLRKLAVNFSKMFDWQIRFLRLKLTIEFDMKKLKKSKGLILAFLSMLKVILEKPLRKAGKVLKKGF